MTCTFNINYAANQYFFPVLFAATAMGICNFSARLFSAFSFIVSGLDEPTPMYIFTIVCALTGVASVFLVTVDQEKDKDEAKAKVVDDDEEVQDRKSVV